MKKLPFVLQLIAPYFFLGVKFYTGFMTGKKSTDMLDRADNTTLWIFIAVCVINIIYPIAARKIFKAKELTRWGMILKLSSIPYGLMLLFISVAAVITIRGIIGIPLLILLYLMTMIPSSVVCIIGLINDYLAKKNGLINHAVLLIAQFFFVADTVASVISYNMTKNNE